MCCVPEAPPTAPNEPDAWRDPAVDRDERLPVPGIANNEDLPSGAVAVVRKPAADRLEISLGVKAVLAMVVEVGLAFMVVKYFAESMLAIDIDTRISRKYAHLVCRDQDQCAR